MTPKGAMELDWYAYKIGVRKGFAAGRRYRQTPTGWVEIGEDPEAEGKCLKCGRELSATLDAYYGKDPKEARKCVKCRGRG